ncbi:MAG: putative lipid II flippase FtsW [Clostridiales Family XIII bacterium]|jgi:cell division protein FtsW|nr:putative lipid II flippase FtsW [Clostridiales Family XIII bacterium]
MPDKKIKAGAVDYIYFAALMGLVVFGVAMVGSASSAFALAEMGDQYYFLRKAAQFAVAGFAVMIAAEMIPIRFFYRFAYLAGIVSLALLLVVLFTPLGYELNGAVRWIKIGSFTFMPGEIAKAAVILIVARFYSVEGRIRSLFGGVLPMLALGGVFGLLIYKQPNLSTAVVVCGIIVGMMFVAGLNVAYLGGIVSAGAAAVAYIILSDGDGYQAKRLTGFLDPFMNQQDGGYQVAQSMLGLGAGGVLGVGFGHSVQKMLYLPEGYNDFILAIIGEELGLVGCIVLLAGYLLLIGRGLYIAIKAADRFSMLLAAGVTIFIAMQVIMHFLVVTAWMPPTGVALPFVSYGGNALLIYMGLAGLVLNVSRRARKERAAAQ